MPGSHRSGTEVPAGQISFSAHDVGVAVVMPTADGFDISGLHLYSASQFVPEVAEMNGAPELG